MNSLKFNFICIIFSLSVFLICNNSYAQPKIELFKDINNEDKPVTLERFNVINDSLLYLTSTTPLFESTTTDTASLYLTDGNSKLFIAKYLRNNLTILGGDKKNLFLYYNKKLYAVAGTNLVYIDSLNLGNNRYVITDKLIYEKLNTVSGYYDIWITNGTSYGNTFLFNKSLNNLEILDNVNDNLYYLSYSYSGTSKQLWKLNLITYQRTFIGDIPYLSYTKFKKTEDNLTHIVLYASNKFYTINGNNDQITEIACPNSISDAQYINRHLYFSLSNASGTNLGIYRLNVNSLSLEQINSTFKIASFLNVYKNIVYLKGWLNNSSSLTDYKADSLFQNFHEVNFQPNPYYPYTVSNFYFKGDYYRVITYSREFSYFDNYSSILKFNGTTLQSSIVLDTYSSKLNASPYEIISFSNFTITKDNFYFTIRKDRGRWNSMNYYVGDFVWKSSGDSSSTVDFFRIKKGTLNSGLIGLSKKDNDIFFFSDQNNGFNLLTADCSSKTLKKFVDSTFIGENYYPIDSKIYKVNNRLFFNHTYGSSSSYALMVSDGTKIGTKFLKDNQNNRFEGLRYYQEYNIQEYNDKLYFIYGNKIYKTDGVNTDILVTANTLRQFIFFNNNIFFIKSENNIGQLWKLNIEDLSTEKIYEFNSIFSSDTKLVGIVGNRLLFIARLTNNYSLISTDGTTTGTNILLDLGTLNYIPSFLMKENYYLFLNNRILKTDGTSGGTSIIYSRPTPTYGTNIFSPIGNNNLIFFYEKVGTTDNYAPVIFDGTNFTQLSNYYDTYNNMYVAASDEAVFFYNNNNTYVSYGTENQTYFLCKGRIGRVLQNANYTFFSRTTEQYGQELWMLKKCAVDLNLNGQISKKQIFSAQNLISSTHELMQSDIIYRAGSSIILSPGFKVNPSSNFKAEIETCEF